MNDAAPPAFAELVVATEATLRPSIAARGIPLSEVDDIAQDVYLEYHRDHARRPAEVEPLRWLKGIARHHCLRWFRRRARASRRRVSRDLADFLATRDAGDDARPHPIDARVADDAAARELKELLIVDDLLSRALAPERGGFANRVAQRVAMRDSGRRFAQRVVAAAAPLARAARGRGGVDRRRRDRRRRARRALRPTPCSMAPRWSSAPAPPAERPRAPRSRAATACARPGRAASCACPTDRG